MFRLKATVKVNTEPLQARLRQAASLVADTIAEKVAEKVRQKIPEGGWYDIYREAIQYFVSSDGLKHAISGRWEAKFESFPAETTLLTITGDDEVAAAIIQHNPWPIDILPAISGGYRFNVVAKPASAATVEDRRLSILPSIGSVKTALKTAGATPIDGLPTINSIVYADIAFMARALEHGLAGLKRVPHWVSVYREATVSRESMGSWTKEARWRIQAILDGTDTYTSKDPKMPADMERHVGR